MSELFSDCIPEYINAWKCLSLEVWMSEWIMNECLNKHINE